MKQYDHKKIEAKWRKVWAKQKLYRIKEDAKKPKCFTLDMFPYPSGEGLHVGHPKGYIATDVYGRMKRMQGFNVLHPMGWDAFGLPAENYALKNKVHPSKAVSKNIARYKAQLSQLGFTFDWDREVNTTDPAYYKWTQWVFLKLYEKGLAFQSYEPINWCPSCKTGLANEDVEDGKCERCSSVVEKKPMRQWVLKITAYADRMLEDLDSLNWENSVKEAQRNWIGRSEGAEIEFALSGISGQENGKHKVKVFTTRPDTLFGATFLAISPELAEKWLSVGWHAYDNVKGFVADELKRRREDKFAGETDKRGVDSGLTATNPANGMQIPVWIVNYVLGDVGTGAIMAVPAHDERDFMFAKKFNLPIIAVVTGGDASLAAYTATGSLVNSGQFDGLSSEEAKWKITDAVGGKRMTTYKLKDWVFSRQRYWGEPIPVVHSADGKVFPVDETDLPVELPNVKSYEPTGTGESPLAGIDKWVNVRGYITTQGTFKMLPKGKKAPKGDVEGMYRRETNTMPQWAGSSWYYLRYIDPKNKKAFADKKKEAYWMKPNGIDLYVGGMEHAARHLIYARFWHKVLFDIGVVSTPEPFARLQTVGLINASDGRKMSKRYGNVINPDDIVATYGADTLRVYEMFMGPFAQAIAWSTDNMIGSRRFIERVWRIQERVGKMGVLKKDTETVLHQTIKKVGDDIEQFGFNTAISQMMICLNALEKEEVIPRDAYRALLKLLAPFAPHVAEALWNSLGEKKSVHLASWPTYDPAKLVSETVRIAVQVNGKVRETIEIARDAGEDAVIKAALALPNVSKWVPGEPLKVIYIKGKILNIIAKPLS